MALQGAGFSAFAEDLILTDTVSEWGTDEGIDGDVALTGFGSEGLAPVEVLITDAAESALVSDETADETIEEAQTEDGTDAGFTFADTAGGDVVVAGLDDGIFIDAGDTADEDNEQLAAEEDAEDPAIGSGEDDLNVSLSEDEAALTDSEESLSDTLTDAEEAADSAEETDPADGLVDTESVEADTVDAVLEDGFAEAVEEVEPESEEDSLFDEAEEVEDASLTDAATYTLSNIFKDANLRTYVKANYTSAKDSMSEKEWAKLQEDLAADLPKNRTLDLKDVTDLTGLNYFTRLEKLTLNSSIKSANLTGNTRLVSVNLSGCKSLSSINVTGLTDLQTLNLNGCGNLSSINVSSNTGLKELNLTGTQLSALDVSNNKALERLYCAGTQIQSLNVSANTNLRELNCSNTKLSSITFGANTDLFYLNLSKNRDLTSIDISKATAVRELYLADTNISNLNISNHASLKTLDLSNVPLKTLNASGCKAITTIDFEAWGITTITSLNVTNCTALTYVYCSSTAMNTLTLTGTTSLGFLYCANTAVNTLDLSSSTRLIGMDCSHTGITSLNVSACKNLEFLDCSETAISSLDVANNESLYYLDIQETAIDSIDLRKNPNFGVDPVMSTTEYPASGWTPSASRLLCGRVLTTIYLNEQRDSMSGKGITIIDNSYKTNSSARITAYYPLGSKSWSVAVQNTYKAKQPNVTWWPYNPQTGTRYCKNCETSPYGNANGTHNYTKIYDVKPTCSKAGKSHMQCRACGEKQPNSSKTEPATGKHSWSKWTVKYTKNTAVATVEHRTCSACKLEQTRFKKNDKRQAQKKAIFARLQPRATAVSNKKVKLTWNVLPDATHYLVYGGPCGKTIKQLKVVKAPANKKKVKTLSYTHSGLKAGTYYKYIVVAYKYISSDKYYKTIESASMLHVPTTGGKYTEYKKAVVNRKKLSLKKTKTYKLKVAADKKAAKKKIMTHVVVRYESTNPAVATVSAKGKVKAVSAGTTYIYSYMQDGTFGRTKVTVK